MEPCSDSCEEDEDLKNFQLKFKKKTKSLKSHKYELDHDKTNKLPQHENAYNTYDSRLMDLEKSLQKLKHKKFDKHGDLVSDDGGDDDNDDEGDDDDDDEQMQSVNNEDDDEEDDDNEDDDDDEEDEIELEKHYNKIRKSVLEESDDEQEETEVDPYATVRKELTEMSFEDRQKLRNKLGAKIYNKIVHGDKQTTADVDQNRQMEKEYKNRPNEVSAKKRVSVFRKVVEVKRKLNRDPRFDDLSGDFDEKKFKHSYGFLEEMKLKEKQKIIKEMKREKDKTRKSELKSLANRFKQYEEADKKKEKKNTLLNKWKTKEKELVKEGKTPYFLKQSDVKKLELAEKYKELKDKGGLDKYMAKRRKKNAAKEKKKFHT